MGTINSGVKLRQLGVPALNIQVYGDNTVVVTGHIK
jgi:hypothetical protein